MQYYVYTWHEIFHKIPAATLAFAQVEKSQSLEKFRSDSSVSSFTSVITTLMHDGSSGEPLTIQFCRIRWSPHTRNLASPTLIPHTDVAVLDLLMPIHDENTSYFESSGNFMTLRACATIPFSKNFPLISIFPGPCL